LGLVYGVWVGAANVADVSATSIVLVPVLENFPRVEKVLADQGYRGQRPQQMSQYYGVEFELTTKLTQGFQIEPKRWIVERTADPARTTSGRNAAVPSALSPLWTILEDYVEIMNDYQKIMKVLFMLP
jgi:transposase